MSLRDVSSLVYIVRFGCMHLALGRRLVVVVWRASGGLAPSTHFAHAVCKMGSFIMTLGYWRNRKSSDQSFLCRFASPSAKLMYCETGFGGL